MNMKLAETIEIATIDAVEIAVEPWTWPFAQARRADIDRHFAAQQREMDESKALGSGSPTALLFLAAPRTKSAIAR